jgi:hypothetical protein
MSNRLAFCTIATPGYLPMAAVLIDSIRAHYGEACDVHLLTVSWDRFDFSYGGATVVQVADLPNPHYWDMALRYDIGQRASAYKPFFLRHINAERRYDTVFYLDVDMQLFARLDEAADLLRSAGASMLLSPHSLLPRGLGRAIDDRAILLAGTFNSGLLVLDASDEAFRFLDWWAMLNRTECFTDAAYFSRDQKWLNLAPTYFERARILRHPGYNVAHFNVDERSEVLSNGELRLFHFTYVHQLGWHAARYMNTFGLKPDAELIGLIDRYIASVRAKREQLAARGCIPMANASDAVKDLPVAVRSAYRAAHPAARAIGVEEFRQAALRYGATTAQVP